MWVSYLLANKLETMCGYFPISHTLTDTTTYTYTTECISVMMSYNGGYVTLSHTHIHIYTLIYYIEIIDRAKAIICAYFIEILNEMKGV